ncbi:MAG TPA: DNA polymerase ligase N-terminal domain-containing protein [Vicinamibacterales bacterium]
MPLKEYRAKRDFSVSPEPAGADPAPKPDGAALFFCVQKHLASHLHYDFRLEHNGVLLSWAVPKGPSLNPADKRLAMHVEDHPLEYGTFEGVIPEGYGAGVVMLWDEGTWEPLVDDVDAALRKGDLKLRLHGVKLRGSWALVRTRGGDGRSWLLLKHRDEWAGPLDIATFAPYSIKSGGDFTDILAGAPDVWVSNRAGRAGASPLLKVVERAVAIAEENARLAPREAPAETAGAEAPAPPGTRAAARKRPATKTAAGGRTSARTTSRPSGVKADGATARSTRRTRAASDRGARSRGARNRPR